MNPVVRRSLIIGSLALAPVLAAGPAAFAASVDTSVNYDCQASTPFGNQTGNLTEQVNVTAPDTATGGSNFDVVVTPAPQTIPSSINGYSVQDIKNIDLLIPVPPNSTYNSADLSGGSNLGPNPPTISVSNNIIDVHLDGPLAGGSTVTFPTVTAHLTASGASGSTITTQLYGTSYSDPGLTFTTDVSTIFGPVSAPTSCYPNPNPVITTTTIS